MPINTNVMMLQNPRKTKIEMLIEAYLRDLLFHCMLCRVASCFGGGVMPVLTGSMYAAGVSIMKHAALRIIVHCSYREPLSPVRPQEVSTNDREFDLLLEFKRQGILI